MAASIAHVMHGDLHIVVHGDVSPSDEEWNLYLNVLRAARPRMRRVLVSTTGGAPSPRQRRSLLDAMGEGRPPTTAVVTGSVVARGVVTALAWIKGDFIRAFSPADLDLALSHLAVAESDRPAVIAALRSLTNTVARNVA